MDGEPGGGRQVDRGDGVDVGEVLGMGGTGCWPRIEGRDATKTPPA